MKTNKQNEIRIKEHNVKVLLDVLVSVLTEEQMDKVCQILEYLVKETENNNEENCSDFQDLNR